MYTVLKLIDNSQKELATQIADEANQILTSKFERMCDKIDGFACTIYNGSDWADNYENIIAILNRLAPILKKGKNPFLDYHIDIAIEPEDLESKLISTFLCDLDFISIE